MLLHIVKVSNQSWVNEPAIQDLEFKIEEIFVYKDGEKTKVTLSSDEGHIYNLKDHLENKSAIKQVWIPSGTYDYLEINFQKWPIAILQEQSTEPARMISRTLTRVLARDQLSSKGESFDTQLNTDLPFPLTTVNLKSVFAKVKRSDSKKSLKIANSSVEGCDYFASVKGKGAFLDIDSAISNASARDIIFIGNKANGKRLHISQANDVAITSECNVTIDSIHLQKSKNVSFSNLSVMPSDPDTHAIMLQGSAFLNENITINRFKVSGQNGGSSGIRVGPHNKNVFIFATSVSSFKENGIEVVSHLPSRSVRAD